MSTDRQCFELFAGGGGAALGLKNAGWSSVACFEKDSKAVKTLLAAGFHGVCKDIAEVDWSQHMPLNGAVLCWASPPCQPHSAAGKRLGSDDPRDGWLMTMRCLRAVTPRWVVIENVRGVPVEQWSADLRALGYAVVEHKVLDAADYGLPQRRQRVFIVAGPRAIRWPVASHCSPDKLGGDEGLFVDDRLPWVGWGAALGFVSGSVLPAMSKTATPRKGNLPTHTISAASGAYLLSKPAPCVMATEHKGCTVGPNRTKVTRASDALKLATGRRRLSIAECAKLQDFPDDYPFQGGITASYRQIGNAVPPMIAELIGRAIIDAEGRP